MDREDVRSLGARPWAMELVGRGPAMQSVLRAVERAGPATSPVLLQGESGTGKELVARAIHGAGPRAGEPFVAENCAALTESLVESELFGHARGAFTGAAEARPGIFQLAHGGTLLLDEIGDMSLRMQSKLLRVLQEGEFRPVGGRRMFRVDVRIISATHRDLAGMTRRGEFRADLYYRLNVFPVRVPPLRERLEDVPALVEHFLAELGDRNPGSSWSMSQEALAVMGRYTWPGNVRELRNVAERATLLCDGRVVGIEHLPEGIVRFALSEPQDGYAASKSAEQVMIEEALVRSEGNKARAADWIGWHRAKLYRRMRKLGIAADFGSRRR